MPEGHSFACEGEAAVDGVSETRSHAVGQSSDKRTLLLRVGRGQPVGLYAPLHLAGLSRNNPSIAQLLWVGSHRSPLLHSTCVDCFCRCLSTCHRLISTASIA